MTTSSPTDVKPLWLEKGEDGYWLESELCHRQMLRAIPVAVYCCDVEGRITFFNLTAAKLWGRHPELHKDLWCGSWRIFRPDGTPLPVPECPMAIAIRENRAIHGEEIVIERPDGVRHRVLVYPTPIRNSEGAVVGAVNTLVDLPEKSTAA